MVPIARENAYQLRQYIHSRAVDGATGDDFKSAFLCFLNLASLPQPADLNSVPLYQRCAIAGLSSHSSVDKADLNRLLGQAARIDTTPRPWVSDVFGVMCVKWFAERLDEDDVRRRFQNWIADFLPQQLSSNRLNKFEKDVAAYIGGVEHVAFASACIPLFLHYTGKRSIADHKTRLSLAQTFLREFQEQARAESSTALLGVMVCVFDNLAADMSVVPPNGWSTHDLIAFLEHIPAGLKRWTWEDAPKTRGGVAVKWQINNEYHVQNLLYVLLAPIFPDITHEDWLEPVGQKTPRVDLYLPSLHTIIEVKFRGDSKKTFQTLISEVAEDSVLYRTDSRYKDATLIVFLWDHTRATQEHSKFKEGIMKLHGISGCVVVSAPSVMD